MELSIHVSHFISKNSHNNNKTIIKPSKLTNLEKIVEI